MGTFRRCAWATVASIALLGCGMGPLGARTTRVVNGTVEGSTVAVLGGACQLTANVC